MCYIDIAYDEIPERYYKESEVSVCRCVCVNVRVSWMLTPPERCK